MKLGEPHAAGWSDSCRLQLIGLRRMLGRQPKRVLDLGCGIGRVLVPLSAAGHEVVGVDRDATALHRCKAELRRRGVQATLRRADFLRGLPTRASFDAALCLGNTFMAITDVDIAAKWLGRVARLLRPGGFIAIDDFPYQFWPELTEGNWLSGMSADGTMQLVWKPGDAVFTLRSGRGINASNWTISSKDGLYRLWCEGSLRLLASAAGLSAPVHQPRAGLIVMRHRNS